MAVRDIGRNSTRLSFLICIIVCKHECSGSKTWVAQKDTPGDGKFLAFYVAMHYASEDNGLMEFSTTVSVIPDVFPYSECQGEECLGSLV